MDFEVSPVALRQGASDLHALADQIRADLVGTYHAAAPDRFANPEWAATAAGDAAVAAADSMLAALAGRCRSLADALASAALEYERTDENTARRWPG
jgi:hypothetical protein